MSQIVIGQIEPKAILHKISRHGVAFSLSLSGTGGPDDGNFQQFDTPWVLYLVAGHVTAAADAWLDMFEQNAVIAGSARGFNFIEFWGWPEIQADGHGRHRVTSRIRITKARFERPIPRTVE